MLSINVNGFWVIMSGMDDNATGEFYKSYISTSQYGIYVTRDVSNDSIVTHFCVWMNSKGRLMHSMGGYGVDLVVPYQCCEALKQHGAIVFSEVLRELTIHEFTIHAVKYPYMGN
jgi:hypothetical protein